MLYGVYKVLSPVDLELVEEFGNYDDAHNAADSYYLETDGIRHIVREQHYGYRPGEAFGFEENLEKMTSD